MSRNVYDATIVLGRPVVIYLWIPKMILSSVIFDHGVKPFIPSEIFCHYQIDYSICQLRVPGLVYYFNNDFIQIV